MLKLTREQLESFKFSPEEKGAAPYEYTAFIDQINDLVDLAINRKYLLDEYKEIGARISFLS